MTIPYITLEYAQRAVNDGFTVYSANRSYQLVKLRNSHWAVTGPNLYVRPASEHGLFFTLEKMK